MPSPHSECGGAIMMSGVAKSNGEASMTIGPTEASLPEPAPVPVPGPAAGLTPAQAPSEVQTATMQRRNDNVDGMAKLLMPWIPSTPESDRVKAPRPPVEGGTGGSEPLEPDGVNGPPDRRPPPPPF